ncbi:hypothetical protein GCM10022243_53760 [Saccharothrix violaceirubra]|uniref:Uncharacterized protein n=1 Tax=Saccharothrix violaceirubra TaxID=413306 RepID=A0A7W7WTS7_9PSEU|nr:hypothetical protein [Saccharothrix violaceirubra]MBB4963439.1 hypothetical protein [Saccharothrix violaceirubra]
MYYLEAVIADRQTLRGLADSVEHAWIVDLGQGLSLLPLTDPVLEAGFRKEQAGFAGRLAAWSANGPVAHVDADFFGGLGTQYAQVWHLGEVVLGPLHAAEGEPTPEAGSPISQALRRLGAVKGDHVDEFDAVGLGRHRRTDHWVPA